jgi:hypothetical protein
VDAKTRAKFDGQLTPSLYKKLLVRAIYIVNDANWRGLSSGTVETAAKDLLHKAILDTLDAGKPGSRHTRTWDPERVPDLEFFLKEAMRSIVDAEHRRLEMKDEPLDETAIEVEDVDVQTAEELLARAQAREASQCALIDLAGENPITTKIIEATFDGCETPGEIVAHAKLTPKEVYEGMRKLRRRGRASAQPRAKP